MSGRRGQPPTQGGRGQDPLATVQANAEALERYVAAIDVTPPIDLSARVLARVAREPRRTPPGRLLAALASLSPRRIRSAFVRNLDAAAGRVAASPLVRAQAIALVAVLVLSVGALGTAGALVIRSTIDRPPAPPSVAAPTLAPPPSPSPTPKPTPTATAPPTPTPTATPEIAPATPAFRIGPDAPSTTDAPGTAAPAATRVPTRTERPRPTSRSDRTPKPDRTPKQGRGAARTPAPDGTPG